MTINRESNWCEHPLLEFQNSVCKMACRGHEWTRISTTGEEAQSEISREYKLLSPTVRAVEALNRL